MRRTILVVTFLVVTLLKVNVTGFLVAQDAPTPRRGDVNSSGDLDITDAVRIFGILFVGDPPAACDAVADANADGVVNLSDGVFLLGFLFAGGDVSGRLADSASTSSKTSSRGWRRGRFQSALRIP